MSASTKLSTAVQVLCLLAGTDGQAMSSEELSRSTGIHSVRLRRILSQLGRNGLVLSNRGLAGGFTLARSPEELHLQEVYCAVETRKAFHLDVTRNDQGTAALSGRVNGFFLRLLEQLQVEIEESMSNITIADVLRSTTQQEE